MTYQIKVTPYFRRMVAKSRLNDQLQILREEYERINLFNEHTIEMQMRKVRLNNLNRKIEEIMKNNAKRHRLHLKETPQAKETDRLEKIKKARSLGQYFSELNSRKNNRKAKLQVAEQKKEINKPVKPKHIKYGNEISNSNLNKMKMITNKRMYRTKASDCIDLQIDGNSKTKSSILTLSENVHLIDLESIEIGSHSCSSKSRKLNYSENDFPKLISLSEESLANESCDKDNNKTSPALNATHLIKYSDCGTRDNNLNLPSKSANLNFNFTQIQASPTLSSMQSPTTITSACKEADTQINVLKLCRIFEHDNK